MQSLCNALLGKVEKSQINDLDFDMERELENQAEEQIEKDSIAEIDRYRRMDEWSSSFQNIYSRTALRCQLKFMQAKLIELDIMQFLQYTRAGTYDLLRLDAFECLLDLDVFRSPELLRWLIYTMSADPSPWLRWQLHRLFGRALAPVAFGEGQRSEPQAQQGGLIIEQESSTEVRQADLARRQTITGALDALKNEISANITLKESLWAACNSAVISVLEISEFLDLCKVLYDSIHSKIVALKYPRYWGVQHLGKVSYFTLNLLKSNKIYITNSREGPTTFLQNREIPDKTSIKRTHHHPRQTQA